MISVARVFVTYARLVNNRADLAGTAMVIAAGAIGTILLIYLLPVIGLTLASAAMILAVALKSARIAAAIGIGSAVFAALVLRQLARCDPAVQDCSYTAEITVIVVWIVTLAATGAIAAVLISRRKSGAR